MEKNLPFPHHFGSFSHGMDPVGKRRFFSSQATKSNRELYNCNTLHNPPYIRGRILSLHRRSLDSWHFRCSQKLLDSEICLSPSVAESLKMSSPVQGETLLISRVITPLIGFITQVTPFNCKTICRGYNSFYNW